MVVPVVIQSVPPINPKLQLLDIEIKQKLGEGNFGEVYYGEWSGTPVALKKISEDDYAGFKKEAGILSDLSHVEIQFC